jgi:hypothetical protein
LFGSLLIGIHLPSGRLNGLLVAVNQQRTPLEPLTDNANGARTTHRIANPIVDVGEPFDQLGGFTFGLLPVVVVLLAAATSDNIRHELLLWLEIAFLVD